MKKQDLIKLGETLFPSPYGVSFILICYWNVKKMMDFFKFPSPYGVIFILTKTTFEKMLDWELNFPSPYGVIFILTDKLLL